MMMMIIIINLKQHDSQNEKPFKSNPVNLSCFLLEAIIQKERKKKKKRSSFRNVDM